MPFTAISSTDRSESNTIQCLRKRFTFANASGVNFIVGQLPVGAVVVGGGIQVITAFNAGTTNTMNIGVTPVSTGVNVVSVYASAVDITALGLKALDDLNLTSANTYSDTSEVTVTAAYSQTGGAATTGVGDVLIFFVTKPVI